jgi:hypothetical protein
MQKGTVDINITKVLIIGIGTIATLGVAYFIWKKIEGSVESLSDRVEAGDVVKGAENELNKSNLTFSETWYDSAADKIFAAMQGLGTDEWSIQSVMKELRNEDDINMLISKFGVRKGKSGFTERMGNLTQWLNWELDSTEMWLLVNAPLKKNGVMFKF